MPTFNRRQLLAMAIRSYLSQDWTDRELIVIDDGDDAVPDMFAGVPACTYARRWERMTVGAKRNLACDLARGEVIVHFDDDDWCAPGRITDQVNRLQESGKAVTGYHSVLFWKMQTGKAYRSQSSPGHACGTSLCYRRSFWSSHRFPDVRYAEDNALISLACSLNQMDSIDVHGMLVARVHAWSTSNPDRVGNNCWPEVPMAVLPAAFAEALHAC